MIDRSVNKSNRLSVSTTSVSKIQNIARFEMKGVSIALSSASGNLLQNHPLIDDDYFLSVLDFMAIIVPT